MNTLTIQLQGPSPLKSAPVFVEVINKNLETVAEISCSIGEIEEVLVVPGKYLVRARFPSGDIVTEKVSVIEEEPAREIQLRTTTSSHKGLEWQSFLGNLNVNSRDIKLSTYPKTWLYLWSLNEDSWSIDFERELRNFRDEYVVNYHLKVPRPAAEVPRLLQVGGLQVPWHFVVLPPSTDLEILIHPSQTNRGSSNPLRLDVVSRHEESETLLSYLTSGKIEAAKVISTNALTAELLLNKKRLNPMGAAIGGYYLLRVGEFERLHNWPINFANWFKWFPDSAVIRAWQLLSTVEGSNNPLNSSNGRSEHLGEAHDRLIQAASQPIPPVYTQGLRLLLDGLRIFAEDDPQDWAISLALERVKNYAAAVDWSRPITTFYGSHPNRPSLSLKTGIPEDDTGQLIWIVGPDTSTDESNDMDALLEQLDKPFGVLAESDTHQLTVVAKNSDVAVGDLFLLPSRRGGHDRFYIFRTTQYANILNRALEMDDIARNKLTMPDSYLSQNLAEELLIKLTGIVLGYAEAKEGGWTFHKPRRLPEHLSNVYRVDLQKTEVAEVMRSLLASQLGQEGLYVGDLLAGEQALKGVQVFLPAYALSHHLGVFGRTGAGKSNLMMVLLKSVMDYNQAATQQESQQGNKPLVSMLTIDPHDEFRFWHATTGGKDGIHGIVEGYSPEERRRLVEPFYYLTARDTGNARLERKVVLSRADVLPDDLASISEFSEQQVAFAQQQFANWGENWIARVLMNDTQRSSGNYEGSAEFLPGTVSAVQRRLSFLRRGQTRLFSIFDPEMGDEYESLLPDILCALEQGRVLIVDTTLMREMEQFLLTTVVARSLFTLRRTLRSVERAEDLPDAIRLAFGNDDEQGQVGLRTLAETLIKRIESRQLPYVEGEGKGGKLRSPDRLPYVNVVVEEAPSVLNPQRMKFGSVFRDISRQGRKFGIGLTVVSQQVSEIDDGVLSQINTELVMALGNEGERRESVRNASADLSGFERELQVMGKGQVIVSASYKDVPLPVQVPEFDQM